LLGNEYTRSIADPGGSGKYDGMVAIDVATPVYEGPFDLLLHLILREEVDIHEISLSTIVDADRIIVLEDGHIVEEGRHETLLGQGGRYAAMWARQSSEEEAAQAA
jgi:hypothetical protein